MGDKMAIVFAKALKDLPLINSLNVCDNALTDDGLTAILDALLHLPNITNLDISNNKIDGIYKYHYVMQLCVYTS